MHLALIVDCSTHASPARMRAAREALEDRGWETLVLRRGADELVRHPAEITARLADCDLALLLDAPDEVAALVRGRAGVPVLAVDELDAEDSRDRLVC